MQFQIGIGHRPAQACFRLRKD